jgi:hypothetical protein
MDSALTRNIFECKSFKVELTVMIVSYYKCSWNSYFLIPVKGNLECRLPCYQGGYCGYPVFQVCCLSKFPLQPFCYKSTSNKKYIKYNNWFYSEPEANKYLIREISLILSFAKMSIQNLVFLVCFNLVQTWQ